MYTYVDLCVRTSIWRALFQDGLSAIPENELEMPMPSSKTVFWSRAFHICVYMHNIYVHIYEEFFSRTWSSTLALALQYQFLEWCLTCFGKELFICRYMYVLYVCIMYVLCMYCYVRIYFLCMCVALFVTVLLVRHFWCSNYILLVYNFPIECYWLWELEIWDQPSHAASQNPRSMVHPG